MDWYQFATLLVAIITVGFMAKSEKKKDEKGEIESAIKHENRHTTTESTLCEVVKTLARIEKKSDEQYKNLTEQIEKLKNSQK